MSTGEYTQPLLPPQKTSAGSVAPRRVSTNSLTSQEYARSGNSPTVLNMTESPFVNDPEAWRQASFRERVGAWCDKVTCNDFAMPVPTLVVVYSLLGALYFGLYLGCFYDPARGSFFSDENMKRFIIYNAFHGVIGLGATSGVQGFRFKFAVCGPLLHFLRPGTLCSPLFPELVRGLVRGQPPAVRSRMACVAYLLYVLSLLRALAAPGPIEFLPHLLPVYTLALVCALFDFSIWQACRGEHYGYMMFCLWSADWRAGVAFVQMALWIWAGLAKCGPWWPHVPGFMMKDSLHCYVLNALFGEGFCTAHKRGQEVGKRLFADIHAGDYTPTRVTYVLSALGAVLEIVFPLLGATGVYPLSYIGGIGMILYHAFIAQCLPFASVQEWNYFSMVMAYYLLIRGAGFPGLPSISHDLFSGLVLWAFLLVFCVAIPALGQLKPKLVPFLAAYRPYMGNWRFSWYVLKKSAMPKHNRLKTLESPFLPYNGQWFYSWLASLGKQSFDMMAEADYFLTSAVLAVPAYRPLLSIMEKLLEENGWHIDDVHFSHSEPYQNQVFGWSLGTGWIAHRDCVVEAFQHVCGFAEKEMYQIQFEPVDPFPCTGPDAHRVEFRCFDVAKGPREALCYGSVPYARLQQSQPCTFLLDPSEMKSGNSVLRGTFMGTYA